VRRPAWLRKAAGAAGTVGLAWLVWIAGGLLWFLLLVVLLPLVWLRGLAPYRLSFRKFYFDEIYDWTIVRPLRGLARCSAWFDRRVVDGLVDFVGRVPPALGALARPMQMGLVQFYALAMALGLLAMVAATFWMFDR
jgi:NADH-quinone oxidoreductase subunit L